MKNYFISTPAGRDGPFTLEELKKKNLKRSTLVWRHPMPDWKSAGELPELEELFSMTPPDFKFGAGSQGHSTFAGSKPVMPKSWFVESILVTLFCCLPFGVVGVVYALQPLIMMPRVRPKLL